MLVMDKNRGEVTKGDFCLVGLNIGQPSGHQWPILKKQTPRCTHKLCTRLLTVNCLVFSI